MAKFQHLYLKAPNNNVEKQSDKSLAAQIYFLWLQIR